MIRVTLSKDWWVDDRGRPNPSRTEVREFEDDHTAAKWLTEDSYFMNSYVWKVVWERVPS